MRIPLQPLLAALLLFSPAANAHSFGRIYNLPIPVWLYLYGAAAALLLSFVVIGFFLGGDAAPAQKPSKTLLHIPATARWPRLTRAALQSFSVALLLLCIASGLFGTQYAYHNFNMTFFWVVFVLLYAYLVALTGNHYVWLNPWRALVAGLEALGMRFHRARLPWPPWLGVWPALLLYFAFIWLELFGRTTPYSLAVALLVYTAINLVAAWLWGAERWFARGELWGVFLGLLAACAPLACERGADGTRRIVFRRPFSGLLQTEAAARDVSALLFVLFMLASTAYDGLRETAPWVRGFWVHLYGALTPQLGSNIVETYPVFQRLFEIYLQTGLLLLPLVYVALYYAFIALSRVAGGSRAPVHTLALAFAPTLVPIALVYHLTHYFTLAATQGLQILRLASDPLGKGWDLFGTAEWRDLPQLIDAGFVWHAQVGLILFGHIVSVYLAHVLALQHFAGRRAALLSQVPMLALMMAFTSAGLWILAQPITSGVPR